MPPNAPTTTRGYLQYLSSKHRLRLRLALATFVCLVLGTATNVDAQYPLPLPTPAAPDKDPGDPPPGTPDQIDRLIDELEDILNSPAEAGTDEPPDAA